MTDYRLPNDWCRCHDEQCPVREQCKRWLDRANDGRNHVVHMLGSPRQPDGNCFEFIRAEAAQAE